MVENRGRGVVFVPCVDAGTVAGDGVSIADDGHDCGLDGAIGVGAVEFDAVGVGGVVADGSGGTAREVELITDDGTPEARRRPRCAWRELALTARWVAEGSFGLGLLS
ncbi:hypothetical protein [Nocardia sp. CNY236]|uniref:hypothetical protein n=1 Tax=Nocardia sp. CNY236 TaxID=1169152 RepID=UPI00048BA0C8|nr:hypothetical protein [Nocardia sp. CNY236]